MTAKPLIIAHRGASSHAPENTLASFQMAIDAGADGVEFDVRLAKDGVAVVIHDATLKRTGLRSGKVADFTSKQLGKIDVGSWFNAKMPQKASAAFAMQTVPTLAQTLDWMKAAEGLIYIELKTTPQNVAELSKAVCDLIRNSPMLPRIIIKSFRLAVISEVRKYLPDVQTCALFSPSITKFLRRRKHIVAMAQEFGAHQISLHRSLVTRKLIALAGEARIPVTVWTADDPKWIARSGELGIRALITNDPGKLSEARDG